LNHDAAPISTTVVEGFGGLPALREPWEDLFRAREHEPSASFEWTEAMVRNHVRPGDRCFLVTLFARQAVVGIVPLVLRTFPLMGMPIRILAPLSEEYNTHSDLLLRDTSEAMMRALMAAIAPLAPRWDLFRLARLVDEAPLERALKGAAVRRGLWFQERPGLPAYVLDLPVSFEAYLGSRSAKFRNYLKRIERKVETAGAGVDVVSESADLSAGFEALLAVERSSWKQAHGSSIVAVERQTAFYRDLCEGALAAGRLHLQWLTLGGVPVAYNLGYVRQGCYHYLKTSYDHAYRQSSPSTYLRARLIESLIGQGVTRLDFPGEPYEWERQWTDAFRWRRVLSFYARTPGGLLLFAADRWKHRGKGTAKLFHVDPRASRPAGRATHGG
jgi:CelD/BcsL family acetyltransferase involved in cellulose biosynthesis